MLLDSDIKKLIEELSNAEVAHIDLDGSQITVKVFDKGEKLFLSTPVYFGGNYIPKSVRKCLTRSAPFERHSMRTSMRVDEQNFKIFLNYFGKVNGLPTQGFVETLEEFSLLANQWRDYLDENDKNDLIYVRPKS